MSGPNRIEQVSGRGLPLRGHDIDTDRIIPARHLKNVTFEGLGEHVFGDERKAVPEHPFNRPQFQGASILIARVSKSCSIDSAPAIPTPRSIPVGVIPWRSSWAPVR